MNEQPTTPFSSSFINYYILSLINTCNNIVRLIILIIIIYVVNITVVFLFIITYSQLYHHHRSLGAFLHVFILLKDDVHKISAAV